MTEVIARGAGGDGFEDDPKDSDFEPLTHEEAQALRARIPLVSPWRVIAVQAAIGGVAAALAWWITGVQAGAWSALYGAATAVVPGALMARGATRRLPGAPAGVVAVGVLFWAFVKVGVSVLMLMLAPRVVQPLSWPCLLAALALCMQAYWLALLWRGR